MRRLELLIYLKLQFCLILFWFSYFFHVVGQFQRHIMLRVSKLCYGLCHVLAVALVNVNIYSRYLDGSFLF